MKKHFLYFLSLSFVLITAFTSCSKKSVVYENGSSENFVQEISPTFIGRSDEILISFSKPIECLPENGISLSPAQKGEWSQINDTTFAFVPSEPYKANKKITLTADCDKLFKEKTAGFYRHDFFTLSPDYKIHFDDIHFFADQGYVLSGLIETDIPVSAETAKSFIKAKVGNSVFKKNLDVSIAATDSAYRNQFKISGLYQKGKPQNVSVSWNGKKFGVSSLSDKNLSGKKNFTIPQKDEFTIVDINTSKTNSILVSFSQILDDRQDILGLVKAVPLEGHEVSKFNTSIHDNVLTIYSDTNFQDIQSLSVLDGIKSIDGIYLAQSSSVVLNGIWEIPYVKFVNDGVILPTSNGAVIPVETKNISGVIVQVYEIYDHNISQFLQMNELDGSSELYRVGEPVWEKRYNFEWKDSMKDKPVVRGLEITDLVKKYPDGMFQIRVAFRKKDIKYVCQKNHMDFSTLPQIEDKIQEEKAPSENSYWNWADYWNDMDWRTRQTYWDYKDDPCHPAFYLERFGKNNAYIKKNVLVSDLGIIAKQTATGQLYVTVADIKTAKPVANSEVTLYSFVGSKIASAVTNSSGTVVFPKAGKTYYVAAALNNQTSFMRLSEGSALSTSHFETGGEIAENGVKGFIYGERGVWRPGNDIYLTFVLQDLKHKIPKSMPVVFELQDSLGRIIETRTIKDSVNGFYPIQTKTMDDAVTGLYTARVKIGGQEWTKSLKIETVVPNRLSVVLDSENNILKAQENVFKLSGAWLHGAPVPNYNADVNATFSVAPTAFEGYSEYTFVNPTNKLNARRTLLWEGKLSADSKVSFTTDLYSGANLPGLLNVNTISRIFEPSGAFSSESKSFLYSPYSRYVGLKLPKGDATRGMLLTDTDHTADVVLLDAEGKPVQSAELTWEIYKLEWKWWWEKDALTAATYISDNSYTRIDDGSVTIRNGKGSFKFNVKYPSWGRYLVKVSDGNGGHNTAKIVYIDWPGWAGRAQEAGSGSASMLSLVSDKKNYNTGETASVSFASSRNERALVTIERNGEILRQSWLETTQGTTNYKLVITPDMAPNVYVHITLLQEHMQTANSLPIRLYGVIPIMVNDPATRLEPVITMAESLQPGKEVVISVSEKNAKPMTYTLAVVDEGLLGLTGFHPAQLHNEFYKKEASRLLNWDLYSYVMNAYTGKLETLLAVGGGDDITDNSDKNKNRFTPVVKYFGPYTIAVGEKKATRFVMPEYVGAVRAMVVAGNAGAYGTAEKSVPVKSDLMVLASLPRTIGTNESIEVPVTVFNGTDKTRTFNAGLRVGENNVLIGKTSVTVPPQSEGIAIIKYDSKDTGLVKFTAFADGDGYSAENVQNVPVESRGIPVTYRTSFVLKPGARDTVKVASPGEINSTELSLELSTLPVINLSERLNYLIRYPHGCIEQITSGAFPQLYVADFIKLSEKEIEITKSNVMSVIDRYSSYRISSGAMGYWPGDTVASQWGSCYAGHFLNEAKKCGYAVPQNIYDPLMDYLSTEAAKWENTGSDSKEIQAYRLFVLSLAGRANLSAMNRLSGYDSDLNSSAVLLLSCAYAQAGLTDKSKSLLGKYRRTSASYRSTGGSFSSLTREKAMQLFACNLNKDYTRAANIAKELAESLSSDNWYSTQETAWVLLSLMTYYAEQKGEGLPYEVFANGKNVKRVIEKSASVVSLEPGQTAQQTATVSNNGKKTLYGILTASGKSVPGTELKQADGLSLEVLYSNSDGRINPQKFSFEKGSSFTISVTVKNTSGKRVENLALTVPIATAFEFSNDRIGGYYGYENYSYQDIRDDFIYTYFDLDRNESKVFTFNVTSAYAGKFYIPAIHVEAMYDNTISAIYPGIYVSK